MKRTIKLGLISFLVLLLFPGCIFIGAPQIASFQSTPGTIVSGDAADLIWAVAGAESVSISPELGSVPLAGSRQVRPANTIVYTLTARNTFGTASSSLTVTVLPKVNIQVFEARPPKITAGNSSTLRWNVTGASSVNISPDIGTVASSGEFVVSPSSSRAYTLTAISGSQVLTQAVTIEVTAPPVVAQFSAAPTSIELGQSSTLSWNVSGANSVNIQPGIGTVPAAGSSIVFPNKTTVYVLTATSDCCVVNRYVTVQVSQFPVPDYLPIVTLFNISPKSIYSGASATLEWNVYNASSVVINNGIGSVGPSGNVAVSPTSSTIYTLTASNAYGFRQVSVGIIVFTP